MVARGSDVTKKTAVYYLGFGAVSSADFAQRSPTVADRCSGGEPLRVAVRKVDARAAAPGVMWLPLADALGAALPAPVRRILAALEP